MQILTLAMNDFACALKNKSFFLILFIPAFIFISLAWSDKSATDFGKGKIVLIQGQNYPPQMISAMQSSEKNIELLWVKSLEEGEELLKKNQANGMLATNYDQVRLLVLQKDAPQTLAIIQIFLSLQKTVEKQNKNWISDVQSLREGTVQKQTMPIWIVMLVLLVGFIIIPSQIAEEKEKKLILAILQTPVHEVQWLIAKTLLGMSLTLIAAVLIHALNKVVPVNLFQYILFMMVGAYCFTGFGIFLGFLCRNQASARTLGLVFYIPLLVPVALSDFSQKLKGYALFLPSYQYYDPLKPLIFDEGRLAVGPVPWIYLLTLGTIFLYLSFLLMKKRWLM